MANYAKIALIVAVAGSIAAVLIAILGLIVNNMAISACSGVVVVANIVCFAVLKNLENNENKG